VKKAVRLLAAIAGVSAIVALSFLGNARALAGSGHGAIPRPPNTLAPMATGDNDGDVSRHNSGHLLCLPDTQGDPAYDRGTWWW
jgi:hypothetical protein